MDLNTIAQVCDAREFREWRPGDAWLGGGTYLFSEPQPHLRRLIDLSRIGWTPLRRLPDGGLEIAATCTVAELFRSTERELFRQCCHAFLASFKIWNMATVGGNLCNALPAGPMISLTAALDGVCLLQSPAGVRRRLPVLEFVTGAGENALRDGELLRSITLPAAALDRRTAFRQASLYGHGRSGVLIIGTRDRAGVLRLTITASTTRPIRIRFHYRPGADELRSAVDHAVPEHMWFDDIHGLPRWRRQMTLLLAEQIRRELV
ncbi:FAD binding domain-containing protein [Nocardia sp. NPDC058058]|uniref:FAD binding domain-containing protein n=1 Tax=Nocardia sp. NPDC058058 TaxID=3346317 RepID=UPI0036DB8A8F